MFTERLKEARKRNGLTQQAVANALSISLNGYQKYEQGERLPSIPTLIAICDLLGVSCDWLLCRRPHEESADGR